MNPMYKMRSCSISRPAYCTVKTRLHRSYLPGVIMSFCMTISVSVLLRAYYCILRTTSKIRLCSKRSIPTSTPKKPYAIGQHHPRLGKQLRSLWQTANSENPEMAYPKIRRILQWNASTGRFRPAISDVIGASSTCAHPTLLLMARTCELTTHSVDMIEGHRKEMIRRTHHALVSAEAAEPGANHHRQSHNLGDS
jgi:hypothetical protein